MYILFSNDSYVSACELKCVCVCVYAFSLMWVKHGKTMISHLGMVTIAPIYGDDLGCKWPMKSQDCRCRYHVAFVDEGHRAEQKATIGYHNLHAWYIKYMYIYIYYT